MSNQTDSLRRIALVITDVNTGTYHYNTQCLRIYDEYVIMTVHDAEESDFYLCEECEEADIPLYTDRFLNTIKPPKTDNFYTKTTRFKSKRIII